MNCHYYARYYFLLTLRLILLRTFTLEVKNEEVFRTSCTARNDGDGLVKGRARSCQKDRLIRLFTLAKGPDFQSAITYFL